MKLVRISEVNKKIKIKKTPTNRLILYLTGVVSR